MSRRDCGACLWAPQDDSFDSMMRKLSGAITVHKPPTAKPPRPLVDPEQRDVHRADEEQLRQLLSTVNEHRAHGRCGALTNGMKGSPIESCKDPIESILNVKRAEGRGAAAAATLRRERTPCPRQVRGAD